MLDDWMNGTRHGGWNDGILEYWNVGEKETKSASLQGRIPTVFGRLTKQSVGSAS